MTLSSPSASDTYAGRAARADQPSKAARIERALALSILRGERAPGTRLPSVRALATELGTTPPTVQRVVDRLESAGLVSARRGSGVTVNDPERRFDPSLLPLWLEALADDPPRAAKVFGDFLELRRVVAAHLLRRSHGAIVAAGGELGEVLARLPEARSMPELIALDQELTRRLVAATGQVAVVAVFSVTERIVRETPFVAEALYGDRREYERVVAGTAAALAQPEGAAAADALWETLTDWDARAVARFEARVARAAQDAGRPSTS